MDLLRRESLYIGAPSDPIFACFHTDESAAARDCVAVICNPMGYEYVHSHRSLRHLADNLARVGIPALRFDYNGTGDSPGTDLDADRLRHWISDVEAAIGAARSLGRRSKICLIGLRLGGTLAALTATRMPIDYLVLWNPCISGHRYVREMQALAQSTESDAEQPPSGALQSAGFLMSPQTQDELRRIDLLNQTLRVGQRALVLGRDDAADDSRLADHLRGLHIQTESAQFSGFADMMVEPHHTIVPRAALESIANWLCRHLPAYQHAPQPMTQRASEMSFAFRSIEGDLTSLTESALRFGSGGYLFGIHCRAQIVKPDRPTIVFFNAGVVHRIGPNRLYVELARNLSAAGFPTFRCDLEGIGDSVLRGSGRENHPYPDTASRDAGVTLRFLTENFDAKHFVILGLCAGAHTAYNTALNESGLPISELLLLNPVTFRWKEGDSLDTQHFRAVARYKNTVRQVGSWKKLLRGEVKVLFWCEVAWSHLRRQVASYVSAIAERFIPSAASPMSRQLKELFADNRKVSIFTASGDPGWDIIISKARHTARKAVQRGDLRSHSIDKADHTFTSEHARLRLVVCVRDHLQQRYPEGEASADNVASS